MSQLAVRTQPCARRHRPPCTPPVHPARALRHLPPSILPPPSSPPASTCFPSPSLLVLPPTPTPIPFGRSTHRTSGRRLHVLGLHAPVSLPASSVERVRALPLSPSPQLRSAAAVRSRPKSSAGVALQHVLRQGAMPAPTTEPARASSCPHSRCWRMSHHTPPGPVPPTEENPQSACGPLH